MVSRQNPVTNHHHHTIIVNKLNQSRFYSSCSERMRRTGSGGRWSVVKDSRVGGTLPSGPRLHFHPYFQTCEPAAGRLPLLLFLFLLRPNLYPIPNNQSTLPIIDAPLRSVICPVVSANVIPPCRRFCTPTSRPLPDRPEGSRAYARSSLRPQVRSSEQGICQQGNRHDTAGRVKFAETPTSSVFRRLGTSKGRDPSRRRSRRPGILLNFPSQRSRSGGGYCGNCRVAPLCPRSVSSPATAWEEGGSDTRIRRDMDASAAESGQRCLTSLVMQSATKAIRTHRSQAKRGGMGKGKQRKGKGKGKEWCAVVCSQVWSVVCRHTYE